MSYCAFVDDYILYIEYIECDKYKSSGHAMIRRAELIHSHTDTNLEWSERTADGFDVLACVMIRDHIMTS